MQLPLPLNLVGEKCNDGSHGCHLVMLRDKPEEESQHAEDGKDLVLRGVTEKEPTLALPHLQMSCYVGS